MKQLKFISNIVKFIVKLGPVIYVIFEAFEMIQSKLEEVNQDKPEKLNK